MEQYVPIEELGDTEPALLLKQIELRDHLWADEVRRRDDLIAALSAVVPMLSEQQVKTLMPVHPILSAFVRTK